MSKTLKLIQSPFESPIGEAYGLIFKIHTPMNEDSVKVLMQPSTTDYSENYGGKNIKIWESLFDQRGRDVKSILLDFKSNRLQVIEHNGKKIEVKLMNAGTERIQDQEYPFCVLYISEVPFRNPLTN